MLTLMIHTSPRKSTSVASSIPRHSIQIKKNKFAVPRARWHHSRHAEYSTFMLPFARHDDDGMGANTRREGHVLRESSEGANQQERQKEGGGCNADSLRRVVCEYVQNPFT